MGKLEENKEKEQPQKGVYEGAVLDFLIETGRTGKKDGVPTTYDEICALDQARGLASLRDKREPGAWELRMRCFPPLLRASAPYHRISHFGFSKAMTGTRLGKLCRLRYRL
ncbi:MAG: hypothetical protein ACLUEJ_09535 [Clostridium sp.]